MINSQQVVGSLFIGLSPGFHITTCCPIHSALATLCLYQALAMPYSYTAPCLQPCALPGSLFCPGYFLPAHTHFSFSPSSTSLLHLCQNLGRDESTFFYSMAECSFLYHVIHHGTFLVDTVNFAHHTAGSSRVGTLFDKFLFPQCMGTQQKRSVGILRII